MAAEIPRADDEPLIRYLVPGTGTRPVGDGEMVVVPVTVPGEHRGATLSRVSEGETMTTSAANGAAAVATRTVEPTAVPVAFHCLSCSGPVEAPDYYCTACGVALTPPEVAEQARAAQAESHLFRCETCGAEIRAETSSRSMACPFCAAPYVLEIDTKVSGRQEPEFVIGFAVTPDEAETIYRRWVGSGGWFRPGDLAAKAREGLRGIYLPFWSFSCRADSTWSAEIGEYWYRTETYTFRDQNGKLVTATRQVQETEWWGLSGGHHAYYSFYLVSGSKGLDQATFDRILPFQLLALKRYTPKFLAGWLSEEYSVRMEEAYVRSEAEFRRREHAAIAGLLPGDTYRGLRSDIRFSQINSDLILLPIYLRSYRYRGKLYRTLINGQTGKIQGEKPVSGVRVGAFVALILLAIFILFLLSLFFGR